MTTILIRAAGLIIVLIASRALARGFRQGTFRSRGHRLLRRKNHPVMFWVNAAVLGVQCAIGLGLLGWALSGLG
jgi:hypothetical protein